MSGRSYKPAAATYSSSSKRRCHESSSTSDSDNDSSSTSSSASSSKSSSSTSSSSSSCREERCPEVCRYRPRQGPVGTRVSVRGRHLQSVHLVRITQPGISADVQPIALSDTKLVFEVPSVGTGGATFTPGDAVFLLVPDRAVCPIRGYRFRITPSPPPPCVCPSVDASSVPSTVIAGTRVILTGSGLQNVATVALEQGALGRPLDFTVLNGGAALEFTVPATTTPGPARIHISASAPGSAGPCSGCPDLLFPITVTAPCVCFTVDPLSRPTTVAAGTTVVLRGTDLQAVAAVSLISAGAGRRLDFAALNDGAALQFTVPADATLGDALIVVAPKGACVDTCGFVTLPVVVTPRVFCPSVINQCPVSGAAPTGSLVLWTGANLDRVTNVTFLGVRLPGSGQQAQRIVEQTGTQLVFVATPLPDLPLPQQGFIQLTAPGCDPFEIPFVITPILTR